MLIVSTPTAAAPNAQFSDEGRLKRSESWSYAATIYSGACGPIATSLLSAAHKGGQKTHVEQLHMSPVQGELAAVDHTFSGCVRGRGAGVDVYSEVCGGRSVSANGTFNNTQKIE